MFPLSSDTGPDTPRLAADEAPPGPTLPAIIVVNYGAHGLVEENLKRSTHDVIAKIIVVDNFSTNAEAAAMEAVCAREGWHFVASVTNVGYGSGNNLGAARASEMGANSLLFLNPDAYISSAAIARMHSVVMRQPWTLVAPLVKRPDGRTYSSRIDLNVRTGRMQSHDQRPPGTSADDVHPWVSGACFMVSAQLWSAVGGFDDDYFLYWEDVDLCRRVHLLGGSVLLDERSSAVHDEGATHNERGSLRAKSPIYYYYNIRNRMLYANKHLPPRDQSRWAFSAVPAAYQVLLQGGRRQFAHPRRTFWPALRGLVAGWVLIRRRQH